MERITLQWLGGQDFELIDTPSCDDMNPKELMLFAVAKCSAMTALALFEKMQITINGFRIEIMGKLTDSASKPQSLFTAITQAYHVECPPDTDHHRIIRALELTHDKYCGMTLMMEMIAPVSFDIYINHLQERKVHY